MGKLPASLFYWGDFVRDPDLRRCTNAEVGVWIRCLCLMFESEQKGVLATRGIAWSDEEVALAVGGELSETLRCVTNLVTKGVASRTKSGALMNRRMYRDEKVRLDTKERVRKFRAKQDSNEQCNAISNANVRECTETEYETEDVSLSFALKKEKYIAAQERAIIERTFEFYCDSLKKNSKRYQLTEERRKKAQLRFSERLKANGGDLDLVERDFATAIESVGANEYLVANGYTDWVAQIFKSQEEFEKRLTWAPKGTSNGNGSGKQTGGNRESVLALIQKYENEEGGDSRGGSDSSGPDGQGHQAEDGRGVGGVSAAFEW